jgi:hypothetical protein
VSAITVLRKKSNKAVKAAATLVPESQQAGTERGSTVGLPLFMQGGRQSVATVSQASLTPPESIPQIRRQKQKVAKGEEQSHLILQAKLNIGQPNDKYEQEADSIADQVMAMSDPKLQHQPENKEEEEILQAKSMSGDTPSVTLSLESRINSRKSGGQQLDPVTRNFFEPRFGQDFSQVRVHADGDAADSARAIGARAYTHRDQIVFGAGHYSPETESGKHLLAHELTHVLQQGAGQPRIQRDDEPLSVATTYESAPLANEPGGSSPDQPVGIEAAEYDPCSVSVKDLTNQELMATLQRTVAYLRARKRSEGRYYDYANLMRRLVPERRRRADMGHYWLASEQTVPAELYQLSLNNDGTFTVTMVAGSLHAGAVQNVSSTPLLTPAQFDSFLEKNNIPSMDVAGFYRMAAESDNPDVLTLMLPPPPQQTNPLFFDPDNLFGDMYGASGLLSSGAANPFGAFAPAIGSSGIYASPFDLFARGNLNRNVYSPNVTMSNPRSVRGAELQWRGGLPEYTFGYGSYGNIANYQDLNRVQANFQVFDFATRGSPDQLVSVTHSLPNAQGDVPTAHYLTKFEKMTGNIEPTKFNTAMGLINTEYGTSLSAQDINLRNYLAVPDDHVATVRNAVENMVQNRPNRVAPMLNVLLSQNPVTINGAPYASWNQVQSARANNLINQFEYDGLLNSLAADVSQRVIGVGDTLAPMQEMQRIRAGTQGLGPGSFDIIAVPDVLAARRLIANGVPEAEAYHQVGRGAATRGGAIGGLMAVGSGTYRLLTADEIDAALLGQVAFDVPLQAGAGAADAYLLRPV